LTTGGSEGLSVLNETLGDILLLLPSLLELGPSIARTTTCEEDLAVDIDDIACAVLLVLEVLVGVIVVNYRVCSWLAFVVGSDVVVLVVNAIIAGVIVASVVVVGIVAGIIVVFADITLVVIRAVEVVIAFAGISP